MALRVFATRASIILQFLLEVPAMTRVDFGGGIKAAIAWSTGGNWRQQMLPRFLVAESNLLSQDRQVAWEGFSSCHWTTLSKSRRRETEKGASLASPTSSKREGAESELREDTECHSHTIHPYGVPLSPLADSAHPAASHQPHWIPQLSFTWARQQALPHNTLLVCLMTCKSLNNLQKHEATAI